MLSALPTVFRLYRRHHHCLNQSHYPIQLLQKWPHRHRPRALRSLHRSGEMSTRIIDRTRMHERDVLPAETGRWTGALSPSRADRQDGQTEEIVPDHRRDHLRQNHRIGRLCKRNWTMLSQTNGLRYIDGWARRVHRERSRRGRRALTPVPREAKRTIIPRPTLARGEILPGQRGTATAMPPLQDGTIHRRGTTPVLINGPEVIIHDGLGTGGSTDGNQPGADHLVPVTMIGAMYHGGGRHPVPAQEGPRGVWCLVLKMKTRHLISRP